MIDKAYVLLLERTTDEQCEKITLWYQSTQYWTQSSIPSVNDSITNSYYKYKFSILRSEVFLVLAWLYIHSSGSCYYSYISAWRSKDILGFLMEVLILKYYKW